MELLLHILRTLFSIGGVPTSVSRLWAAQGWMVAPEILALGALYMAALFALRELRSGDVKGLWDSVLGRPTRVPEPT